MKQNIISITVYLSTTPETERGSEKLLVSVIILI